MSKLYAIKTSPGKGRGVFATKAIAAGTQIMKDRVALRVQKHGPSVREADVLKRFNLLNKADQERFLGLHEGKRQYNLKARYSGSGRVRLLQTTHRRVLTPRAANVFGGDGSTTLYFEVSLINHACVPNVACGQDGD